MNWKDLAKIAGALIIALVVYTLLIAPQVDKYKDSQAGATV